jgi:hypothetical protein
MSRDSFHDIPRRPADAHLMRARVAIHGLLIALEAVAYSALDGPSALPHAFLEAGRRVDERFAACRKVVANGSCATSLEDRERLDRIRSALGLLEGAHCAFICEGDARMAAVVLLDRVHEVAASATTWV